MFPDGLFDRPGGTVTLLEGTSVVATGQLQPGDFRVGIDVLGLAPGEHVIVARYEGDPPTFAPSTSAPVTQIVLPRGGDSPARVDVQMDQPQVTLGQSLTATATVRPLFPSGFEPVPTGTVTFRSDGTVIGTVPLDASGVAAVTFQPTIGSGGGSSITAAYEGDPTFSAAVGSGFASVRSVDTTTEVAVSANPVVAGQPVTLTARVTPAATPVPLAGVVTFSDGFLGIGTAAVDQTGTATLTLPSLGLGTHYISANFSGFPEYTGSFTDALVVTVVKHLPRP